MPKELKNKLREEWEKRNNEMLWTTATESPEVFEYWLGVLEERVRAIRSEIKANFGSMDIGTLQRIENGKFEDKCWLPDILDLPSLRLNDKHSCNYTLPDNPVCTICGRNSNDKQE